jgi:HD-GYP domain-containing protein (c-di-GMP phosphodiesterase class II)
MSRNEDVIERKSSQDIINQLSVILRNAQIHDPNNVAVVSAIERFLTLINPMIEAERTVTLELIGEFFYLDGMRIRYSLEYLINFDFLIREFKNLQLGSIIFKDRLRASDVKLFVEAFIAHRRSSDPYDKISEMMADSKRIVIDRLKKVKEGDEVDVRKIIKKTYFNAVSYSKGVMKKIKSGEKVNIKKAKRIVETMVDQILGEEQLLLSMTAIKEYDEYTYHHSVNVSILSVALGQRIGLSKRVLTELGLAALFHDMGKIEVPHEVLNKPSNFNEEEWRLIRKHPVWGVRSILKLRGFDPVTVRSSIVAFEHHLHHDLSGYPKVRHYKDLDFFSRIVSIADQYDAMTSARVYSRVPMSPDKALSLMMERSDSQLDPLLLKFFINMIGVYPIGSLVMLDTKELGLVYETDVVFVDRPRVLIIVDKSGKRIQGRVVSLTEKDKYGRYLRSVVKTLDANKYKINLAEFLL